jgi:mono/diheme cytochrome c family protein
MPNVPDTAPAPARRSTRTILLTVWGLALIAVFAAGALRSATPPAKPKAAPNAAAVEHGKYLVTIIGCNDCHTPLKMGPQGPEPDMTRMLSGHPEGMKMPLAPKLSPAEPWNWSGAATLTAFAGPWGVSYAANITSDRNTGIGGWSEDMFLKALKTGKHMGQGREILPPMPWHWFAQAKDQDLKDMYAYLQSVPPIKNHVPDAVVAPPPPPGKH